MQGLYLLSLLLFFCSIVLFRIWHCVIKSSEVETKVANSNESKCRRQTFLPRASCCCCYCSCANVRAPLRLQCVSVCTYVHTYLLQTSGKLNQLQQNEWKTLFSSPQPQLDSASYVAAACQPKHAFFFSLFF